MTVMMYECDYCLKQFRDTPAARRRHLLGLVHRRAKALWYNSLSYETDTDFVRYYHPKKDLQHFNSQGVTDYIFAHHIGSSIGNLPPSLTPPPEVGYPPLAFIDWG